MQNHDFCFPVMKSSAHTFERTSPTLYANAVLAIKVTVTEMVSLNDK